MFTDNERINYLLHTDADLYDFLSDGSLSAQAEDRPKYITNYIGSKQKLVDWIWSQTPDNVKTVTDAFSGSSAVGYMYKTKGLSVISNDRLHYCYHTARAIVENDNVTLSDEEVESLFTKNTNTSNFVQTTFKGIFFAKGVHEVIDTIRTNIESLSDYKKDIALFALGRTCIGAKSGFGHFGTTKQHDDRMDSPDQFKERYKKTVDKINKLVFKNEGNSKAYNESILEVLPKIKADVAYFDPPYATEFSQTNYEKSYHFIEGLMTYWKDKEVDQEKVTRIYKTEHKGVTKTNASQFFTDFLNAAKHIPKWIISYRDKAYPNEKEMKKIVSSTGKSSKLKSKDHQYQISAKRGDASLAKEYLFLCSPAERASSSAENNKNINNPANFKTRTTGSIISDSLASESSEKSEKSIDKKFKFILTHSGTNRNGDHFTIDELKQAASTAVNKKIDLSHSQEFKDIVGGIVDSWFVEDGDKSRVEATGELFTEDSEGSRMAYKLLKKGIVSHVSMECDYQEGECSICGKRIKSKSDYCTHLKNYKGHNFQGKPVFEILHGITFTGMGLLDREGADAGAEIKQVATLIQNNQNNSGGKTKMADKDKNAQDEFNNSPEDENNEDDVKKIKAENERLKRELEAAKKKIEELENSQQAAERRVKAEKILKEWEKRGRKFETDEARDKELNRLASMSDDALSASESIVMTMAEITPENNHTDESSNSEADNKPENKPDEKTASNIQEKIKADAGVKPLDINDKTDSLEDKLSRGILTAYHSRG